MTITKENLEKKDRSGLFNRSLYAGFVALGIYFLINKDFASTMSNLGLALLFDPFDQKISWSNRPLYQRTWLFVHVGIVLVFAGILLISNLL